MKRSPMPDRRTWMRRKTRLRSTKPLVRQQPLREVSERRAQAAGKPARSRDTGPDRNTRHLVAERDDWRCFCCGTPVLDRPSNLQHRDARGMGGTSDPLTNSPANLITLLGTPTTLCHGRVEKRLAGDNAAGYWLKNGQVPAETPVWHWRFGWVLLDHDGGMTLVEGDAA